MLKLYVMGKYVAGVRGFVEAVVNTASIRLYHYNDVHLLSIATDYYDISYRVPTI